MAQMSTRVTECGRQVEMEIDRAHGALVECTYRLGGAVALAELLATKPNMYWMP